ncbi:uncharacterized protein zgc:194930 isoform X2 [Kryptolebias marmoratus]|uniref:Uncharacterized LOC108241790 n=2 Tax=Kryptolebias marmoratus TaxID=37003 RepID=A0A3Q3FLI8_KRYMA|nr:uncharacterized protein zgc:194930 isoform X2 [Kryptolebias marmoratus]XP_037832528.1 uncharacterized protein zgc:194930 isoform X2 [Kryptolebias marmoratus]
MGCQCCRMVKSYIYDPSVAVDVRKTDSTGGSLYQPSHGAGGAPGRGAHGDSKQKHGVHNLGYSDSTLKLEFDNNRVNHRLHAAPALAKELHQQASAPPAEGGLYIIQPEAVGPRWVDVGPSQVPVYPNLEELGERERGAARSEWEHARGKSLSVDEIDEGVGGTPEYLCDTGDEGSVLSVDIHTSTTSLSSGGTRNELTLNKTPDISTEESSISVTKSDEDVEVKDNEVEVQSVTDSMVAEALAALEAATAGEESE